MLKYMIIFVIEIWLQVSSFFKNIMKDIPQNAIHKILQAICCHNEGYMLLLSVHYLH
jgi:hypothetical protein